MAIVKNISKSQEKSLPEFRVGSTVKVHNKIREGAKERIQVFEGLVIARKGGNGVNASFIVRKISNGVGVERIFPLHSPNIERLEVVKAPVVAQSKIYYVRERQNNQPRVRKNKAAKTK